MPPKRGRGRGRGTGRGRSPENTPPRPESSETGPRNLSRGRGKPASEFPSFEQDEPQRRFFPERSHDSPAPSASRTKESRKGYKVAPEGFDYKSKQKFSDESGTSWKEQSRCYEPSSTPLASSSKESRKGHHVASEDYNYKEKSYGETHKSWAEVSRGYKHSSASATAKEYSLTPEEFGFQSKGKFSDESQKSWRGKSRDYKTGHSTSAAKEYHKQRRGTPEDFGSTFRGKRSDESTSYSKYRTETSYDSEISRSSTSSEEYRKKHEVIPEDTDFKFKEKFSDESHKKLAEKSLSYESPVSSSLGKERHKSHKEDPEDSGVKFKQKSFDESHRSYKAEKSSSDREHAKAQKISPEDIGFKFEQKSPGESFFPMRPGVGVENVKRIKVISNLYEIEFPTGYVFHYDIDIIEDNPRIRSDNAGHKKYRCLNTKRNRKVISLMLDTNPLFKGFCGAFDGQKNLLMRKELKIDLPYRCTIMLPREGLASGDTKCDTFKVEIKSLVSKINLDSLKAFYERRCNDLPQDTIMVLETILRHGPCLKYIPVGRSFFSPYIGDVTPFGGGLDIWFGYHQSIRLSQWKPTVNLDISATAFWRAGPLLNIIADFMNTGLGELRNMRYLHRNDLKRINRKLKQRQVKVTHLSYGRKCRIVRLRDLGANQEYIELTGKDGKKARMTVAQYFKNTYGKVLEYGNLPCVQVQPEAKNIFMPIEVCELIEGQHYKGEFSQAQKTQMIQFTSKAPYERFKKIENIVRQTNMNKDETVKGFGIRISNHPLVADARILQSPSLVYKDRHHSEKEIRPHDGKWDVRQTQFFQPAKISNWVLLSFQRDRNLIDFAEKLKEIGQNLGLQINRPSDTIIVDMNYDKEKLFGEMIKKKNDLAVIIIPTMEEGDEKRLYGEIKKAAETAVGLTTQCIKAERLQERNRKRWPQIASNLCLKINAKLGGENHSLFKHDIPEILYHPVIIIGADVNHPAPTQPNQPSIAACVGSLDCFGKRFGVSIRAQVNSNSLKRKVEHICDLEDMVYDLLLAFNRHTRQKPEKIIYFRDGVSEGELVTVKNEEVCSIRKACLKLNKNYKPGITAIVVQKRHHVRFRPWDQRDGVGPKGNVPPGTVIDTTVTHPQNFDFFLCSQFGLQGTSRPSHYLVVEDDNDFSADELQKLTFHMCHMYVRCTKSISIPAPVAYADLVAYRARKHLDCKNGGDSSSSDCSLTYRLTQDDIDAIKVKENLKNSMYFV